MSRIQLNFLPTFRTAARTQNFRATALALNLTHSAVSQQIGVLEDQLGVPLFVRVKRSVVLTPAGRILLRGVESGLTEIENAALAARGAVNNLGQVIRISVLPSFAQRWLLPRLSRWRPAHPDLTLSIEASPSLTDLTREGFHAAIRSGTGQWPNLVAEPLFERQGNLILVGSPEAARRHQGRGPEALLDEALIGDEPNWTRWFAANKVTTVGLRAVANFSDYGLMLQAVEQDIGIALTLEILASDALLTGKLHRLSDISIQNQDGTWGYYFVYPPELQEWPPLVALRAWLRNQLDLTASARSLLAASS